MTALCDTHSQPLATCRECSKPIDTRIDVPNSTLKMRPPKQKERKPLKKSSKKQPHIGPDVVLQDAMLGRGRCYVADGMRTACTDGRSQRAHIVPQALIRNTFEHGAYNDLGRWNPIDPDLIPYLDWAPTRSLQNILDDTRNIVPTCPNHNVDGIDMVIALGMVGTPDGFDDFLAEYGFEFIDGRYWRRVA